MPRWNRPVSRARNKAARWLATREGAPGNSSYYEQQPTCQIGDLWYLLTKFLGERESGVFVEVGAYDGVSFSNTWGLAERSWRGIMIEPIPAFAEHCRRNHAAHEYITVVECAVGDGSSGDVRLYVAGALSTANDELFDEYIEASWLSGGVKKQVHTAMSASLDSLLMDHNVRPGFDLLSVDVEGYESAVFSFFDLTRWAPKMMIIELVDTHPELVSTAKQDAELMKSIGDRGYTTVFKDRINTIFVRDDIYSAAFGLQ